MNERAQARAAQRKVSRAAGLLRDATRELAALAEGEELFGVLRVHDWESRQAATELVALGCAQYGAVDVLVVPRPSRRSNTPTTAPTGAKEPEHAPDQDPERTRAGAPGRPVPSRH